MNERIKELRKTLGLTMEEFGSEIGLSKSGISAIENGERNVTEKHIKYICNYFGVREEWLRTGEGEKFHKLDRDAEIMKFCKNLEFGSDNFKKRFVSTLTKLTEKEWEVLEQVALKFVEENEKEENEENEENE